MSETQTPHEHAIQEMVAEAGPNITPEDQAVIDELRQEQANVRAGLVGREMGHRAIDMRDGIVMTRSEAEEARRKGNDEGAYKGNRR